MMTSPAQEQPRQSIDQLCHTLNRIERRLVSIEDRLAGVRREFYRVDELARVVGRSEYTIRRWIAEGKLTAIRIEGTGPRGILLVPREQVEKLIDTGRVALVPGMGLGEDTDRACGLSRTDPGGKILLDTE